MAPTPSSAAQAGSATPLSSPVATTSSRRRAQAADSSTRVLQNHYPPKELDTPIADEPSSPFVPSGLAVRAPIVIRPSGRPGFSAPKAATFFLGKDHERWRQYDRERFSGLFSWERVASAISSHSRSHRGSRGAFSSHSSGSDDEHSDSGNSYRSSRSRSSRYSGSRRPSEGITPPITPFDSADPLSRPRRFSTNGPEAAFQRHETVIGIHTPRRRSSASSDALPFLRPLAQINPPSAKASSADASEPGSTDVDVTANAVEVKKRQKKLRDSHQEHASPKKKEKKSSKSHTAKTRTKDAPVPNKAGPHGILDLDDAARPHLRRLRSNLQEAAAAAAASSPSLDEAREDALEEAVGMHVSLSDAALDGKGPLSAQDLRSLLPAEHRASTPRSPARGASPRAPPLKLAQRLQPQKVEGTLYDKTGPYREGAVTDGLSVRLFSAESEPRTSSFEDADLSNSEHPVTKPWGRRGSSSSYDGSEDDAVFMQTSRRRSNSSGGDNRRLSPKPSFTDATDAAAGSAIDDNSSEVYLITTPDNRVSSAAKLRRWAMDGAGNFYAAMEIKSIEAKLRAADPSAGRVTRELTKELEETYLDDILDEVQKAQTLNPTRSGAVSKILKTEDERYIRLEEDYPEEAFFVIAGCEEAELNGVILTIFVQAIRTLARFHASGWMHGDVKLENLMFDENGDLVVIDYENANPYRGIPGGDGQVQLVSYDWIPPEACPGPMGRRMGPSGDLWALGCNLIRAFALRDGVEDSAIRETLLGRGQKAFLDKMSKLVTRKERGSTNDTPADDYFAPRRVDDKDKSGGVAGMPWDIFAHHVDLEPILNDTVVEDEPSSSHTRWSCDSTSIDDSYCDSHASAAATPDTSIAPSSGRTSPKTLLPTDPLPSPSRLLYRFARSEPELLAFVLSRCVVASVSQRNIAEAEAEALQLADWFESNKRDTLDAGKRAVEGAIEMSGSVWVKPRLDDARKSLGLSV
ncbi:likely protein kinase [Pseudozyma hubeiensis SY62]|uniref:Likely protein kinase n=1 Tax=Pseudozyma hubeiensis (strain SY62) TaxID=1305764 RepID=R9P6J0_PSEHS|nr:likely protein kinase [Pseudozyma hubeiensis SY62]GAC97028.1 likely protein kinase [Pseudozyma hubeiensis SY62]